MTRYLIIAGLVLATLLLAALGASMSLVRSIRSLGSRARTRAVAATA
jgi:hypothetical protein